MTYRVIVGINYVPHGTTSEVRAEPGDLIDDVPIKTAKAWVADGVLEKVDD